MIPIGPTTRRDQLAALVFHAIGDEPVVLAVLDAVMPHVIVDGETIEQVQWERPVQPDISLFAAATPVTVQGAVTITLKRGSRPWGIVRITP